MNKVHLALSDEPFVFGGGVKALCGESVPHAQSVEVDEPLSSVTFCRHCFGPERMYADEPMYAAAIMSGQEKMNSESL